MFAKIGDPFYAELYAAYNPLHLALVAAYNIWKAQGGTQKGSTVTLDDFLLLLSPGKSGLWNRAVQLLYPVGSSIYTAIFPKKMKVFNTGTKLERINAVAALEISLTGKAGLAATLADVTAFSASLSTAETAQTGLSRDTIVRAQGATEATPSRLSYVIHSKGGNVRLKFFGAKEGGVVKAAFGAEGIIGAGILTLSLGET